MAESLKPKRIKERTCGELRERARSKTPRTRDEARAELTRRRDNLRGAVVPEWEKRARGGNPRDWKLW